MSKYVFKNLKFQILMIKIYEQTRAQSLTQVQYIYIYMIPRQEVRKLRLLCFLAKPFVHCNFLSSFFLSWTKMIIHHLHLPSDLVAMIICRITLSAVNSCLSLFSFSSSSVFSSPYFTYTLIDSSSAVLATTTSVVTVTSIRLHPSRRFLLKGSTLRC